MIADLSRVLPASGLVLIGSRGTGKSTVGRIIAERTMCPFVDVDAEVERRSGRTIRAIFESDGEVGFRQIESSTLADLVGRPELRGGTLATGGGAILALANRQIIRSFGLVVWLTADVETLTRRLANARQNLGDRPALTAVGTVQEIASVLAVRTPLYREAADIEVPSNGRSVHEVADVVIENWQEAITARNAQRRRQG